MMMRKVLLTLACVAMLCATAQAALMDDLDGVTELGLTAITPTYTYNVADEVGVGNQFAGDNWYRNFVGGAVTSVSSGYTAVAGDNSEVIGAFVKGSQGGGDWWNHRPNDANWSFSLPSNTKVIEISFSHDWTESGYASMGIGSSLNYASGVEFWDVQFGMDDGGWAETQWRGTGWFNEASSGLVHAWTTYYVEYQLMLDMENKLYQMKGFAYNADGGNGEVILKNWTAIAPSSSLYTRDPADLDLISELMSPGNGFIELQITGLGDPIPEPGTLLLLGMGLSGLVFYGWRRRK